MAECGRTMDGWWREQLRRPNWFRLRQVLRGICTSTSTRQADSLFDATLATTTSMPSISSIETVTPQPLPSLPPSPTEEEDLSRAHAWREGDDSDTLADVSEKKDKGKGKQLEEFDADCGSDDASQTEEREVYPPMNHDEAETRRVEEVGLDDCISFTDI